MTRKTPPVNVSASVRARLLKVAKERREDFMLTLMNYAAERLARMDSGRCRVDWPVAWRAEANTSE